MKFPTIEPLESRIAPAVLSIITPVDNPKNEGSGAGSLTDYVFKIQLDVADASDVTVRAITRDGTATDDDSDFEFKDELITIPAGQTEATFTVKVKQDTDNEADETFAVELTSPSNNATLGPNINVGATILNDDAFLSINDVTISEGDNGTSTAIFTVSRTPASNLQVTVKVSTMDVSTSSGPAAGAAADFVAKTETLTFLPNESFKTFAVTINGDRSFESSEEIFKVLLSEATGAVIVDGEGIGKIQDANDPAPTISIGDAQVTEGNSGMTNLEFTVTLSALAGADVFFDVASALATGADAATSDVDFTAINLTGQVIPAGQKTLTISVPIIGDETDELNERFFVNLTNATTTLPGQANATTLTITDAQGVGTILNDDLTASIGDVTIFEEGSSGETSDMLIPVLLSRATTHDVVVTFTVTGQTATSVLDFEIPSNLSVTIPAGETSANITIKVKGDTLDEEDNETFNVALTGATDAQVLRDNVPATIRDDDAPPTLIISSPNVTEGQDAVFTVTLSSLSAKPVEVRWVTEVGSASSDDFTETTSEQILTIPAGQTTGQIRVLTTNDSTDELDETFKVNVLTTTTNANVGTGISGTATIGTNDLSTLSITDLSEVEGDNGTKIFSFTVTRSASATLTSTVNFTTLNGTALVTAGDYDLATGTLTFDPGDQTKTISVTVHGDAISETDETFFVSLSSPVGASISDGVATGTIRNDEVSYKLVRLDDGPLTVDEEGAGGGQQFVEFKVVRTGQLDVPGVVSFTTAADDTNGARQATSGTDFTAVSGSAIFAVGAEESATIIRVPITKDTLAEGNETFKVKLTNGVNGIVSSTAGEGEAVVTIADNDTANLPRVVIGDARFEEGNSGTTNMVFKVKLVAEDGTTPATAGGDITVVFDVAAGTATVVSDFSVPTTLSVVFSAGQTEKDVIVSVEGDNVDEPDETLLVNLTSAKFSLPVGAPLDVTILDNQATGTIANDDLTLSVDADSNDAEGLLDHDRVFTVSIPAASSHDVVVHYKTSDSTAISSGSFADYIATEGDVTIAAGQTSATFSVQVKGDRYAEQSESFKVLFSDVHGAKLADTETVFTLTNDDAAPSLTIGDATIVEGDSGRANLVFNVTLAGGTQEDVKVDFSTVDGIAKSSGVLVDYESTNGTLTFAPSPEGRTMQVSIPVLGDTWKEDTETFSVKLTNARLGTDTSGVTLVDDTGTGTIQDNGDTQLGIFVSDARVVEGGTLSFKVETTAKVSGSDLTFKASTRNGTAKAGTDFNAISGQSVTIPNNQSSATVSVTVTQDSQFEQSEFLFLDIGNLPAGVKPVAGNGSTISTRGIIFNDDIRIVNAREFEYVDVDGDLVNVKVSKGKLSVPLSGAGGSGNDVFFTLNQGTVGGRFFQRLDLSDDGFEFNGANITVTAKPQVIVTGEVLGDGKANVGAIDAALPQPGLFQFVTGQSLGKVKISGDLGRIIAGSTKTPAGVRVLDVGSLGAGTNIPNSPVNGLNPNSSIVLGPIGNMTVRGDVVGSLSVIGDSIDQPIPSGSVGRIGKLVVKGVLRGGSAESSGQIAFTGGIGSATLGGIVGGSGGISGALLPVDGRFSTSIGNLTVLGDIVGGSGDNSGFVNTSKIGSLTLGKLKKQPTDVAIEGSLIGGGGNRSGGVFSDNNIGSVLVNGDIQGGSGANSARISATHNLGSIRVTGDVIGGNKNTALPVQDASNSGVITGGLLRGSLRIEGDIKGGDGNNSGAVEINGDIVNGQTVLANVSSVTVGKSGVAGKGNIIGGSGADSGHIAIAGMVKKFVAYGDIRGGKGNGSGGLFVLSDVGNAVLKQAVIKGNLIGGSTDAPGTTGGVASLLRSGVIDAGDIGKLTVEGRIQGGVNAGTSLAGSGGIFSNGTIGTLKVLGNGGTDAVIGDKSASVVISAVEGIRSATFSGNVSFAEILAGYSAPSAVGTPRGSLVDAGANIGTINVTGTFSASSIVAGVDAGGDGKFGTIDDQQTTTGQPANQNLISRIASVILGNVVANANASATTAFGIVAEQVDSIKVNGAAITVQKGPHNDEIEIGGTATKIKLLEV